MKEPAKIEKVTDDALSRSIISSVIGIIICMVCLVGTTWAWYSLSIESGVSETFGANFDFDVVVTKNLLETTDQPVAPQDGQYSLDDGIYTVTLTKSGSCTATKGFCQIIVKLSENGAGTPYYYELADTDITIIVTGPGKIKIKFIPMLGTPTTSEYAEIANNEIVLTPLTLNALPPTKAVVPQEETTSKEPIDNETDDNEIDDSTDDNETIESDEGGENVNENEVPDETPANPEQTEPETPTNPETAEPGTPTESEQEPPAEGQPTETTTPEPQE